jgi:hypothetical protein
MKILAVLPLLLASLLPFAATSCAPTPPAPRPPTARPVYQPTAGLPGETRLVFSLAGDAGFFDQPWPSDLRRTPQGLDLHGFPGAQRRLVGRYLAEAQSLDGYSLSPTVYVRFTAPPPPLRLPRDLPSSRAITSGVFLVDIDPASPARGVIYPVETRLQQTDAGYLPANTLAIRAASGFLLQPGALHALVVRRDLTDPPLGTELSFEATKATGPRSDPAEERARQLHGPALDALESLGVSRPEIGGLAVFRTQTARTKAASLLQAAAALKGDQAPRLLSASVEPDQPSLPYRVISGMYCTPNYQQGIDQAPFLDGESGKIAFDGATPRLAALTQKNRFFSLACGPLLLARFVLSVPRRAAGPEGYPLMVSSHGTGGDARSFLGDQDFAGWGARQGIAVVSTDQPLHGASSDPAARPGRHEPITLASLGIPFPMPIEGLSAPMLFYNPLNPGASRDNQRQSMVDAAVLLGLFGGLDLGAARSAEGSPLLGAGSGLAPPRLRAARPLLAGHSQGSQSIAVLGALDPRPAGILLSGSGGDVRHGVIGNKEIKRFQGLLNFAIGLTPDELTVFHPLLSLVQMLSDDVDPQTYGPLYRDPARPPRSVLHVEGIGDSYNPMAAAEALAISLGTTPIAPLLRPVPGLSMLGYNPLPVVRANGPGGRSTLALLQLAPTQREDGHFVIYYEDRAWKLIEQFLASAAEGAAVVGP